MKLFHGLGIVPKVTLMFVVFAALLLAGVGTLAYTNGRSALESAIISALLSTATEKEAALGDWLEERETGLVNLAKTPAVHEAVLTLATTRDAAALEAARRRLVQELQSRVGPERQYLGFLLLDPETGQVTAATEPGEEGQFKQDHPYFIHGRKAPYVQSADYTQDLPGSAMIVAVPIRSVKEPPLGILVGRLNLAKVEAIISLRASQYQTDETFLVNSAHLFVTPPRLISDPALVEQGIHDEAVKRCLAPGRGVILAEDYRHMPAIIVYRWLSGRQLCLITKIDQAEALAPVRAFGQTLLLIGTLALGITLLVGLGLARTITRPVRALQAGVAHFGRGELEARLPETSGDELGQLAREFNTMAAALADKEARLQRHSADLEQMVQERTVSLRESEERFRATFEQAAVGIAHLSLEGRWLRVNQKLCDIVGYSRETLLEKTFREITHPDDLEADLVYRRQMLAGSNQTSAIEKRYLRRDGSTVWVNVTLSLVRELSGGPKHFIAVIEDITQRKDLEEQFRQAQKMEAVGRLSGGIAHDFNNLLVVINGYSELLLKKLLAQDDPARWYIEEIRRSGQLAAALTRQLLTFSRRQLRQPRVLDLNEIVSNMETMLRRLIGEDIELSTLPGQRLGWVKADPGQLEQVIVNLVVNARDAMPDGGKLTIETGQIELHEIYAHQQSDLTPGSYVMLTMSDTGIGMAAETRSHIFEPFYTTKEAGKGTGLGLATVYGIVKQSGGDIWVHSEPGQGATFSILLPCVDEAASSPEPDSEIVSVPEGTETILLVEDEADVRRFAHKTLEMSGYTVLEAATGIEALRLYEQQSQSIQLLLSDIVMSGGMNGQKLAEHLTSLHPQLKVLLMSGYTSETLAPYGLLRLEFPFLQKPFTPDGLIQKVREVLDTA